MQAIVTKFIGPTSSRGSRYKAKAAAGSITAPADYSLNLEGNHRAAAMALVRKLGWGGHWVGGGAPSDDGFVFVCEDDARGCEFTVEYPTD